MRLCRPADDEAVVFLEGEGPALVRAFHHFQGQPGRAGCRGLAAGRRGPYHAPSARPRPHGRSARRSEPRSAFRCSGNREAYSLVVRVVHRRGGGRPARGPAARGGKTLVPVRPSPAGSPRFEDARRPPTPPRTGRRPRRRDRSTVAADPCSRRDQPDSCHPPLGPDLANPAELALHGLLDHPEFLGDFLVGVALHLPEGDASQCLVAQGVEQPSGTPRPTGTRVRESAQRRLPARGRPLPSRSGNRRHRRLAASRVRAATD